LSTPSGNPSKNYVIVFVITILFFTVSILAWFSLALNGIASSERVVAGSSLIVQLDSFFGGGYLAGFFLYANTFLQTKGWFPRRFWSWFLAPFVGVAISGLFGVMGAVTGGLGYLETAFLFLVYAVMVIAGNLYRFHQWYKRPVTA
jgi:hypothetical protein